MTINEAILHCNEVAEKQCNICGAEHKQLADWLTELIELRKRQWISVQDRLPEAEVEVLVAVFHEYSTVPIITTAIYEDGTVPPEESDWNWTEINGKFIPKGWWEYRHYNSSNDIYDNAIDGKVTHWQPLPNLPSDSLQSPEPPKTEPCSI